MRPFNVSRAAAKAAIVFTIGHSTRTAAELSALLLAHEVEVLCDTRSFPRSRTNPQFNQEELAPLLAGHGIEYQHHPLLGGRRRLVAGSSNLAWQNPAFRAYADYMQSEQFGRGIELLELLARRRTCAVMCSELAWWRCHRRLISDRLTVDGFEVLHIMGPRHAPYPHKLSPGLTAQDGQISYPALQEALPL